LATSVLLKGRQLGCVACALLVGQLQIGGHNMPSSLDSSVLICVEALNCRHPIEATCGQRWTWKYAVKLERQWYPLASPIWPTASAHIADSKVSLKSW
jgi:hypothetical protein